MEMNIGNKIRELRKKKGITQEQLASALGITSQAVSKWEMSTGYPDIAMLPIIAGYFGVSMDTLFNYDVDKLEENIMNVLYNSRGGRPFEEAEKILLFFRFKLRLQKLLLHGT
jgi:transcriptional regulator with XRE-family HTH domain